MLKHKCGQCEKLYKTEKEYLSHKCSISGFTPKQSGNFTVIYQSEPPKVAESGIAELSEKEILKAVSAARRTKRA